jgi:hypothetical protein
MIAFRIRWIYSQLMDLVTRLEHPRPQATTPLEFLPTLVQLFPALPQDLTNITQAYNQVRYGELPESEEELTIIIASWERVKDEGKKHQVRLRRRRTRAG